MKEEISVAARFLIKVVENGCNGSLSQEQLEGFQRRLEDLLCARFENHWFPEKPTKGQAYRCIRVNEVSRRDMTIDQAAIQAGLSFEQLQLPNELTIWVDPKEVCCRFGESQGSFCILANFKNGNGEVFLDQVNFDEIRKKSQEFREKINQDMCTRKNGRRGFLSGGAGNRAVGSVGTSPNYKGGRNFVSGGQGAFSSHHGGASGNHHHTQHHPNHHASHHQNHHIHMGGHNHHHTPSPAAVSWYNSVNGSNNSGNGVSDMFSSSPPNHYFGLAKFSPPKYGFGSPSKWSPPGHHSAYGQPLPSAKGSDKYHWFNHKATIKA